MFYSANLSKGLIALAMIASLSDASAAATKKAVIGGIVTAEAGISAGKLQVTGTTLTAGMLVQISGTSLKAISNAQKKFAISALYYPATCQITLHTSLGNRPMIVADCGAKGTPGADGQDGAKGQTGSQGQTGPQGPTGAQGPTGTDGATGKTGPAGPKGATGSAARIISAEWQGANISANLEGFRSLPLVTNDVNTTVMVTYALNHYIPSAQPSDRFPCAWHLQIYLDNTPIDNTMMGAAVIAANEAHPYMNDVANSTLLRTFVVATPGAHSINIRAHRDIGACTVNAGSGTIAAVIVSP